MSDPKKRFSGDLLENSFLRLSFCAFFLNVSSDLELAKMLDTLVALFRDKKKVALLDGIIAFL
jgi:hypothetical protein